MEMAAEHLREEATRRAVEGTRLYKHHPKTGDPLRHPELCLCDHGLRSHAGEEHQGGCGECDCARFRGAPYYEHAYSDRLLERLLEAGLPEEFARRSSVEVKGVLGRVDLDVLMARLPDEQISRLSRGEPLDLVLGEMGEDALRRAVGCQPSCCYSSSSCPTA